MNREILLTLFRVFHIFGGIFWVGAAAVLTWYVMPAVTKAGPAGGQFMNTLTTKTAYPAYMPIVAITTVVSGLVLYGLRGGFTGNYYSSTGNWILAIGAFFGIMAWGHGGAVMGRLTKEMQETGAKIATAQGPPPQDHLAKMGELQASLAKHSKISFYIMVVAVLGMSLARYL